MALYAIRFIINSGSEERQLSLKIHIFLILFYHFLYIIKAQSIV